MYFVITIQILILSFDNYDFFMIFCRLNILKDVFCYWNFLEDLFCYYDSKLILSRLKIMFFLYFSVVLEDLFCYFLLDNLYIMRV